MFKKKKNAHENHEKIALILEIFDPVEALG